MKKIIAFILMSIVLLSSTTLAETITLKLVSFPHPTGEYDAWFEIPNFIIIYNVNDLTEEQYNTYLVHEYQHYLCWKLWKIHPQNHERCFIE